MGPASPKGGHPKRGQNRVSKPTKSASPKEEHIAKPVPQSQPNRPYQRKRTVRNNLVPQSQQDRLYLKGGHPKRDQNRASGSTKSTPSKKAHCKKQIGTSRPTKSASPKKRTT